MTTPVRQAAGLVLFLTFSFPSFAWGPVTQQAIVTTAMHVLTKEGTVELTKLQQDVRNGASASIDELARLYPNLASGPVRAIESEMRVLRAVRGGRLDAYYAYRLGMLGRLVAQISAPLLDEQPLYRDQYYNDVDSNIERTPLRTSSRTMVNTEPYFARVQARAGTHKDMILKDYQEGIRFEGVAKTTMAEDTSRSVDAVADVWYTILTSGAAPAGVSMSQVRGYVLAAIEFYIGRRNEAEIEASYQRLSPLTPMTPDMLKSIGDMFYAAGFYDRAVLEYQAILAVEPNRKDVVERIAQYYVKTGDDWLSRRRLELAYEAYANAAGTDPLHPEAEGKRLETERLISERDARLEAVRHNLAAAEDFQAQAERAAMQQKYGDAILFLKQAEESYGAVTDEFAGQYRTATLGLTAISDSLRLIRNDLVGNAQTLSGTSFLPEGKRLAAGVSDSIDTDALRALMTNQFNAEIARLKQDYRPSLEE